MADTFTTRLARAQALLGAIANDLDSSAGSALLDILHVTTSMEMDVLYSQANGQAASSGLTATGAALDNILADAGLTRIPAVYAVDNATWTGTVGTIIPIGARVWTAGNSTAGPVYFDVTAAATIGAGGTVTTPIQCEALGSIGNVAASSLVNHDAIAGVTASNNLAQITSGSDGEQNINGNAGDSLARARWQDTRTVLYANAAINGAALGVAGCAFATVVNGSVGSGLNSVYAGTSNGSLSTPLQSSVQTAVNAVLPVTISATVSAFDFAYDAIAISIAVTGSATSAENALATVVTNFLATLGPGQTLQPYGLSVYVQANLVQSGFTLVDLYVTSAIPTVLAGDATHTPQLLRLLAPPTLPALSQASTGGSYSNGLKYVVTTWLTDGALETLASAEASITLTGGTATQEVIVTAPATFPAHVTQMRVYMSDASGTETYQGTISTPGGTLTIGSYGGSSTPPPVANTPTAITFTVVSV